MNLSDFILETKGKQIALPNGEQLGQCVSLLQQYLIQVFNIPFKARGHAKDFGKSLVNENLAYKVKKPTRGDIIVYSGSKNNDFYGHVAIFIDENLMYDQNNSTHDDIKSGYSKILAGTKTYFRIKTSNKIGRYILLIAKAIRTDHKLGNKYIVKVKDVMYDPYKKYEMLTSKNDKDDAYISYNQIVNITEIYIDETSRVWGKLKNCWIVLVNKDGSIQAEYLGD